MSKLINFVMFLGFLLALVFCVKNLDLFIIGMIVNYWLSTISQYLIDIKNKK